MEDSQSLEGTLIEVHRRSAVVRDDAGMEYACLFSPMIDLAEFSNFAVGDRVRFRPKGAQSEGMVTEVLPRRNRISRPGPAERSGDELILAANVDRLVVVMSLRAPDLNPRLLDRYLVIAAKSGIEPVICLNKSDLGRGMPEEADYLSRFGYRSVLCSARTGHGLDTLKAELAGGAGVLSGPSGAGKSSLVSALLPGADPRIGEMRKGGGKGRHTTTSSRMYRIPGSGWLIDTPGIRELGLWEVEKEELAGYFRDFAPYVGECRFRDCLHRAEPGCAVREAVERGCISPRRYESYLKLLDEVSGIDRR